MKTRYRRRLAAALALVLLAGSPAPAPALAQNERPDLAIEVLGLKPGSQREVLLRVTNVGQWWADRTSATVETVAPTAGNQKSEQVPDLGPKGDKETASEFEFTYTLAADCDGHEIKASLKAAKTFNGNTETNLANNNVASVKLCASKSQPKPSAQSSSTATSNPSPPRPEIAKPSLSPSSTSSGILISPVGDVAQANPPPRESDTKINTELVLVPAHMRPGTHTLELKASATKSLSRMTREGPCPAYGIQAAEGELLVGWHQVESECFPFEGSLVQVAQTAVKFDLAKLVEIPGLQLRRAVLFHNESKVIWTDGEGKERTVAGCVAALGIATSAWEDGVHGELFPNDSFLNVTPGSAREWDVTGPFERQLINAAPRFGFVLRGSLEQLEGDDDTSCLSAVSNIRMLVTYEVPPDAPPPSTAR